jgi:hypothetical protein
MSCRYRTCSRSRFGLAMAELDYCCYCSCSAAGAKSGWQVVVGSQLRGVTGQVVLTGGC